ncbi:MAG TPA: Clp protease N-terminal domain-containing protein, partial [Pyrinomonadaceae bacterium]|nr:Clp protease N-terminal domain-containing protein [Pyrinomonadaceae bacterium]
MADVEIYRDRFAESGWEIFDRAVDEARRREQNYVGVGHVLHALIVLKAELFTSMLRSLFKKPQEAHGLLLGLIEERVTGGPKHTGE